MKFTNRMKINGELAIRNASEKAQKYYGETDPLDVFAYETDDGWRYDVRDADGFTKDLTFEKLESWFETMYDICQEV